MKLLKRLFLLSVVATVAASCSTGFYSSMGNGYDDLYAMHDRTAIAARQKAEAEARKAERELLNSMATIQPGQEPDDEGTGDDEGGENLGE